MKYTLDKVLHIFVTLVFFFCAGLAKVHVKLIECVSEE